MPSWDVALALQWLEEAALLTVMRGLDELAESVAGMFKPQGVANTMWVYTMMGPELGASAMRGLEGRAEAVAGTFNPQDVVNTLWLYATMGREPGAALMPGA